MAKLRDFGEIVHDFSNIADFVIVYIEEAHPSDGWALKVRSSLLTGTIIFIALFKISRKALTATHMIRRT